MAHRKKEKGRRPLLHLAARPAQRRLVRRRPIQPPGLGRHSLGTRDRAEAGRELARLDLTLAVRYGLADPSALDPVGDGDLPLDQGRQLYLAFAARPRVARGVRPASVKRYKAVFDKFVPFALGRGVMTWNRVTAQTLSDYASHLVAAEYAYRTQYLELTCVKQAVRWMVSQKHLPASCRIELRLDKPEGTDTYCWTLEEVRAMLDHCRRQPGLGWLADVLATLAYTGMRISEAVHLRWSDGDLDGSTIRLADETSSARRTRTDAARTLKGGEGRVLALNDELKPVLGGIARHPDGYVFHGPEGGLLKSDTVRRALIQDVLEPLSDRLPTADDTPGFADGRLHSFRHFFASLCANRGVSQRVVMRWLGHKDSRMVEYYYHLHDAESRRQMRRVSLTGEAGGPEAVGR